jgi:hypothetical protein
MRFWRSVGGLSTIAGGATVTWEIIYPNGRDVGTVVASPNILESSINTELVAFEQGEIARQGGHFYADTHFSVKVRNVGAYPLSYNLNIGDWL